MFQWIKNFSPKEPKDDMESNHNKAMKSLDNSINTMQSINDDLKSIGKHGTDALQAMVEVVELEDNKELTDYVVSVIESAKGNIFSCTIYLNAFPAISRMAYKDESQQILLDCLQSNR